TADQPVPLPATKSLLEWVAAPGSVANTVTTNGTWFLTIESSGQAYRLHGPTTSFGTGEEGTRIPNAPLDPARAGGGRQAAGGGPAGGAGEVTELGKGEEFTIGSDADVPTVPGGTWALGGDTLLHATTGSGGTFCLAAVDLDSRESAVSWCAAGKQGFKAAHVT